VKEKKSFQLSSDLTSLLLNSVTIFLEMAHNAKLSLMIQFSKINISKINIKYSNRFDLILLI